MAQQHQPGKLTHPLCMRLVLEAVAGWAVVHAGHGPVFAYRCAMFLVKHIASWIALKQNRPFRYLFPASTATAGIDQLRMPCKYPSPVRIVAMYMLTPKQSVQLTFFA